MLGATGLRRGDDAGAALEWALLAAGSTVVVALLWAWNRALRVLACTLHSLQLSVAFGVAGVTGVMHAFGGPEGALDAPGWALVGLGLLAAWSVVSLLACAALVVAEVRAGDAVEEGRSG